MEKRSVGKLILGDWSTMTIVTIAIGAALYGVLMVYGAIPIFTNTQLTSAMVVPVVVGGLFGAVPAMITLLIGNMLADLIGGWGMWFDWSIGNAVLGFCIGLLPVYGARIKEGIFTIPQMIIYAVIAVVGNVVAFGVITPIFSTLFYGAELRLTLLQALFASVANVSVLIIIGIPLLIILANRYKARTNLALEDDSEEGKEE